MQHSQGQRFKQIIMIHWQTMFVCHEDKKSQWGPNDPYPYDAAHPEAEIRSDYDTTPKRKKRSPGPDWSVHLLTTIAQAILIVSNWYEANQAQITSASPITHTVHNMKHTPRHATLESCASVLYFPDMNSTEVSSPRLLTASTFPRCFQVCQCSTIQGW